MKEIKAEKRDIGQVTLESVKEQDAKKTEPEERQDTSGHNIQKPEQAEPEVTLTVAECSKFPNLGEHYENISTVDEAIAIWKKIPPERMNGIPSIGVNIHMPGTEPAEDLGLNILSGKGIDVEIIDYVTDKKSNAQVMEVITELVVKLPDVETDGMMSREMEEAIWEKRMPDLTPAEQLAVEIDCFLYDCDWMEYCHYIANMTENVSDLIECISQNDTSHITEWLTEVITEGTEPEETKKAKELLEKLAEYKPLAKIEEMEEQNYNMVDNVLNNGAGEKARKEEHDKKRESSVEKTSLKARLAEKKEIVSSQGKGHEVQDKVKKEQREM